jgi:serine/threonine protein kinase/tetratricopeptide (TPR) repeat protein
MRAVTGSACLSDEELATLASSAIADDPRLPHIETCDACRTIWLHSRDTEAPSWTVGRYHVRGTLGAGGLGVVLLGWDPVLQREVAIKFPAARGGVLLREAQALAAIRHRNVVAVHDFGDVDGDVYFTMERVDGVPLDAWWPGAGTTERLRALLEVAAGLGAIHAAGLLHCDIKPGNIVVARSGDVVIVDLGLATSHEQDPTLAGGTPGYRAPELDSGAAPSIASDEYAFWCVVRQCLATARLSARQRSRLDALIARGTHADPSRRFGSMAACSAALRSLGTRPRTVLLAAAAAGAVAIAASAAFAMRTPKNTCDADLPGWSPELRSRISQQLAARPDVLARVVGFVEGERKAGHELLVHACQAPKDPAWLRARSCVLSSWQWVDGHLRAIANGHDVRRSLDDLPLGVPTDRCAPGGVTASPPAINANASLVSRALLTRTFDTGVLPPHDRVHALEELGPAIDGVNNAGLAAAWHLELADAQHRIGNDHDAAAHGVIATDLATRNGDDLVLARARLLVYLLRDIHDRNSPVRDAEVEAIVTRAGSPGLLGTFYNAAAQRALALGDVPRARALFERAVTSFAAIELAPSSQRGSTEQSLGTALRFSQSFKDAQVHFERAVEILTSRYGASDAETQEARLAAGHNLLYLGRADEGSRLLDALADELVADNRERTALAARVAMARCQVGQVTKRDALARCTDALAASRVVFGEDALQTVQPLLAVAQLTMATSVRAAVPLLEKAVAISEKQAGNPTDLPYARGLYALALHVVGREDEGLAIAKLAIADLERFGQKDLVAALREHFPSIR